jgi:hypothetical protein
MKGVEGGRRVVEVLEEAGVLRGEAVVVEGESPN